MQIEKDLEILLKMSGGFSKNNNDKIVKEGLNLIEIYKNKMFPDDISDELLVAYVSTYFRNKVISLMGFALLTNKFLDNLKEYIGNRKCLEVMAGKGSLSKGLKDRGVDIKTTDNFSWKTRLNLDDLWTDVENLDCIEAVEKYGKEVDFIICSWIPLDSNIGYEVLKKMNEINPGCKMIVIGEGKYGCTASDEFFDSLEYIIEDYVDLDEEYNNPKEYRINAIKDFKSWGCIYDRISIVKYNNELK